MKQRIKDFFFMLWYFISYPFCWRSIRKVDRWLAQAAAEDRAKLLTERDVEFLKSIGVDTTLDELREQCMKGKK